MLDAVLTGAKGAEPLVELPHAAAAAQRAAVPRAGRARGSPRRVAAALLPTAHPFLYTVSVTATEGVALEAVEAGGAGRDRSACAREGITAAELEQGEEPAARAARVRERQRDQHRAPARVLRDDRLGRPVPVAAATASRPVTREEVARRGRAVPAAGEPHDRLVRAAARRPTARRGGERARRRRRGRMSTDCAGWRRRGSGWRTALVIAKRVAGDAGGHDLGRRAAGSVDDPPALPGLAHFLVAGHRPRHRGADRPTRLPRLLDGRGVSLSVAATRHALHRRRAPASRRTSTAMLGARRRRPAAARPFPRPRSRRGAAEIVTAHPAGRGQPGDGGRRGGCWRCSTRTATRTAGRVKGTVETRRAHRPRERSRPAPRRGSRRRRSCVVVRGRRRSRARGRRDASGCSATGAGAGRARRGSSAARAGRRAGARPSSR